MWWCVLTVCDVMCVCVCVCAVCVRAWCVCVCHVVCAVMCVLAACAYDVYVRRACGGGGCGVCVCVVPVVCACDVWPRCLRGVYTVLARRVGVPAL